MIALSRQFFLAFAVVGSVTPLITVFLKAEAGFSFLQIGLSMTLINLPMLISPGLITLLADRQVDSRKILRTSFAICTAVFLGMYFTQDTALILTLFVFYGLAFVAMLPLQDGYYFSLAEDLKNAGKEPLVYPTVRVWGTIGFIVPSLILYYPLKEGASLNSIMLCAVGFALLSLVNTFTLPRISPRPELNGALPSRKALEALWGQANVRWLCIALMIAYLASSAYYGFIANYMVDVIGVAEGLVGPIMCIGVAIEIAFTIWMPKLQARIGLRGILIAGLACMSLRMGLLAVCPNIWTALLTQACHGLEVLALFVVPVMFINRLAGKEFRNSIQGMFIMTVSGSSRVVAGALAGLVVSRFGLQSFLVYGTVLAFIAMMIVVLRFDRIPKQEEAAP